MIRLFTAISLPDSVALRLSLIQAGVPGARWSTREQLHLTLRFIGDVDESLATEIDDALSGLSSPRFDLQLKGVGEFGGDKPRAVWADVADREPPSHLTAKIESLLQRVGLPAETRKYRPHITLARLRSTPPGAVMDWLTDHARFASESFTVSGFHLYSSRLTPNGSIYVAEQTYPLR
jgi:2'-5' RNA ligase